MKKQSKSKRKTARQKLETVHPGHGAAFPIPGNMERSLGKGTMIVPRPLDVEDAMRTPRKGKLITLTQIRASLAKKATVDQCCPLTTGIFARLAAEASEEDAAAGKKSVTPWWRTVAMGEACRQVPRVAASIQATRLRRMRGTGSSKARAARRCGLRRLLSNAAESVNTTICSGGSGCEARAARVRGQRRLHPRCPQDG